MKIFQSTKPGICRGILLTILLTYTFLANASSDNAKVICSSPHSTLSKNSVKTNVIGLSSMDEVMPDCSQHVVLGSIQSLSHSDSGISVQSLNIKWNETSTTVSTNIPDTVVFNIDDIRSASQFIQVGKNYLVHYQLCEGNSPSLISMYALDLPNKSTRKSKNKSVHKFL